MRFCLDIDLQNAAFEDDRAAEVARILREIAGKIMPSDMVPGSNGRIRDCNGNACGSFYTRRT